MEKWGRDFNWGRNEGGQYRERGTRDNNANVV